MPEAKFRNHFLFGEKLSTLPPQNITISVYILTRTLRILGLILGSGNE